MAGAWSVHYSRSLLLLLLKDKNIIKVPLHNIVKVIKQFGFKIRLKAQGCLKHNHKFIIIIIIITRGVAAGFGHHGMPPPGCNVDSDAV